MTTSLLEVCELGDLLACTRELQVLLKWPITHTIGISLIFHPTIQPNLPAQAPGSKSWIFPIILHKADIMPLSVYTYGLEATNEQFLRVPWLGLKHNLRAGTPLSRPYELTVLQTQQACVTVSCVLRYLQLGVLL